MNPHLARLALVWAVVPFAFFSFAQTKLPNYIALELPALALLVALWFDRVAEGEGRRAALVATAVVPLTIGAVAFAIALFARDAHLVAGTEAVMGALLWMGSDHLRRLDRDLRDRDDGAARVELARRSRSA